MKSWLIKFRISNAIDDRKAWLSTVEQAISRSEDARCFAEDSLALEQALKKQRPGPEGPAGLHLSIMRAVRNAAHESVVESRPFSVRWITVSSFVLLIALGILGTVHFSTLPKARVQPAESPSLVAAISALDLGGNLIREAPDAALSPLSDEMQSLNRDLAATGQFLLASLP